MRERRQSSAVQFARQRLVVPLRQVGVAYVSGLDQALGTLRSPLLIQKALELVGEVRSLGS